MYTASKYLLNEAYEKRPQIKLSNSPDVWGPQYWFTLHNMAAKYPIFASSITKERLKGYILGIPYTLPCETCTNHAIAYIESLKNNLDIIVSGRESLFKFFVDFHNYVNARYKKPLFSYEDAYKLYS